MSNGGQNLGPKIIVRIEDPDLRELAPGFLSNRRQEAAMIGRHLQAGDYASIQTLGHQMKGMGGGYGFEEITTLGSLLEEAAKKKDSVEVEKTLDRLLDYLNRVTVDG